MDKARSTYRFLWAIRSLSVGDAPNPQILPRGDDDCGTRRGTSDPRYRSGHQRKLRELVLRELRDGWLDNDEIHNLIRETTLYFEKLVVKSNVCSGIDITKIFLFADGPSQESTIDKDLVPFQNAVQLGTELSGVVPEK
ncbi:hypothetical protein CPC16_002838 [Podila verticillata]|nr:hypothetical protein CPC16_002838 [Podila verticillata]